MKKSIISLFYVLFLFSSLIFSAACGGEDDDPCDNVICINGSCNDGSCACDVGYEPESDNTCVAQREKFIGDYTANGLGSDGSTIAQFNLIIKAKPGSSDPQEIELDLTDVSIGRYTAKVNSYAFTLNSGQGIDGNGNLQPNKLTLKLTLKILNVLYEFDANKI